MKKKPSKIFYCRDVQSVKDIVTLGTYQERKLNFLGQKPNPRPQKRLDNVISALNSRFPQSPVVQATALATFNNWPNKGENSIAGYYLITIVGYSCFSLLKLPA